MTVSFLNPLMRVSGDALKGYWFAIGDYNHLFINGSDSDHLTSISSDNCSAECDAVSPGKSVWTSARSTWSGRRNLINADHNSSMILDVANLRNLSTSNEGLLSTLPSWCMFEGMK